MDQRTPVLPCFVTVLNDSVETMNTKNLCKTNGLA